MNCRAGIGFDAHRLVAGRRLILGGVEIPFDRGLLGHSDADVLTHAIMDAVIGAMGLGDIGQHFPDTDDTYKDASGIGLLGGVRMMAERNSYEVINIDAVISAQAPKLSLYFAGMKDNIAGALRISPDVVNVKATTEEGLGYTGDGSGMSARAVCLLCKKE